MTSRDEALRALEKKWRDESNRRQESAGEMENDEPQDAAWNSGIAAGLDECADELATILSDRQEVAPVAWIAPSSLESLRICRKDEHNGFVEVCMREDDERTIPLYTSTGQTSDARDALLRIREAVTQEDESAFGYSQVSHGSGIPRAYSVRDNILCTIDRELGINGRTRMDEAVMLVRDVCEMDPADPDAPDTVCIRVSDLTRIAERYTHAAMRQEAGHD